MQTQNTDALIEAVNSFAGIWVKAKQQPKVGHYYFCKVDTKRDCVIETIVEWAHFRNLYYDWDLNNVSHFGDFGEDAEVIEWLDPAPETKAALLDILQGEEQGGRRESDEEAAKQKYPVRIVAEYDIDKVREAREQDRKSWACQDAFLAVCAHLRSQQSAEIKALEEKVAKQRALLYDAKELLNKIWTIEALNLPGQASIELMTEKIDNQLQQS